MSLSRWSVFAHIWGLRSLLPLACDIDKCFMVNHLILRRFAEVISAKAAKQIVSAVLSKLQNGMLELSDLSCPDSIFSSWGP